MSVGAGVVVPVGAGVVPPVGGCVVPPVGGRVGGRVGPAKKRYLYLGCHDSPSQYQLVVTTVWDPSGFVLILDVVGGCGGRVVVSSPW